LPSEPDFRDGVGVFQCLSRNAAKAKMRMRMRAKPPIITWAFVKWPYIAFSIPLNVRNRQEGRCGWVPTRIVKDGGGTRLFRIDQGKNSAARRPQMHWMIKADLSKQINIET